MTKSVINDVQEFLTVVGEDRVYQIVNVQLLLNKHPPSAVIAFLEQLRCEYKAELSHLIKSNKSNPEINELVAKNFRIKMAVNTIRNFIEQTKQEAA
jgi:hypothetical protein